jgi:hypothetical protein
MCRNYLIVSASVVAISFTGPSRAAENFKKFVCDEQKFIAEIFADYAGNPVSSKANSPMGSTVRNTYLLVDKDGIETELDFEHDEAKNYWYSYFPDLPNLGDASLFVRIGNSPPPQPKPLIFLKIWIVTFDSGRQVQESKCSRLNDVKPDPRQGVLRKRAIPTNASEPGRSQTPEQ